MCDQQQQAAGSVEGSQDALTADTSFVRALFVRTMMSPSPEIIQDYVRTWGVPQRHRCSLSLYMCGRVMFLRSQLSMPRRSSLSMHASWGMTDGKAHIFIRNEMLLVEDELWGSEGGGGGQRGRGCGGPGARWLMVSAVSCEVDWWPMATKPRCMEN